MSLDVNTEYTIYFAGALFDHKELIGNAILASYINEISMKINAWRPSGPGIPPMAPEPMEPQ